MLKSNAHVSGNRSAEQETPGAPVHMSAVTATIMGAHGADSLSATLLGKAPKPFSFAYLGQGIAIGRYNAIGFNNYPDDKPVPPYFIGWLGYQIREIFVRYLAAVPRLKRRWPGLFVWPGKGRYEHVQRREQAKVKQNAIQLIEYNERT
jgi:hypothetical protein